MVINHILTPYIKKGLFIAILLTFSLNHSDKVFASTTYYVSKPGLNTGTCPSTNPCSFSHAQSLSQSGDTIHITNTIDSISITKPGLTIQGGKVDGSNNTSNDSAAILINASDTTLEDIEITNGWEYGFRTANNINNITARRLNIHHNVRENFDGQGCKQNRSGGWGSAMRAYFNNGMHFSDSQIWENCGEGFSAVMSNNIYGNNLTLRDNFSVEVYPDQTSSYTLVNSNITCQKPEFQRFTKNRSILLGAEGGYGADSILTKDITIQNNQFTGCRGVTYYLETDVGGFSNINITHNNFSNLLGELVTSIPGTQIIVSPNTTNNNVPSPSPTPKPGDLNEDGHVNIFDFNLLVSKFGDPYTIFDFNMIVANYNQ